MKSYHGIGLMSGTSLDGVDLAYCSFSENRDGSWQFSFLETETVPYSPEWHDLLATVQDAPAGVYAKADTDFGKLLGSIVSDFIHSRNIEPQFVASHGQTIFHQPERSFTAQIGDGETMVATLPCPLITNFRARDLALGGQGAPLVPFGERHLFPNCSLFLNLGGFSNITAGDIAFDVSPCNFALNRIAAEFDPSLEFDPDGDLARSGKCDNGLLEKLDALPYYDQAPPKSLGREWFEEHFLPILKAEKSLSHKDQLATLCHHIAGQIARAAAKIGSHNTQILITGGGFRNRFLIELLEKELLKQGIRLHPDNNEQLVDYKEALIFAFLGLQTLLGRPNILPSVTGAETASIAGSIHLPNPAKNNSRDPLAPFR